MNLQEVQAKVRAGEPLHEVQWPGASFAGGALRKAVFHRADLSHCDFTGAMLEECSFVEFRLDQARFNDAALRLATFH